MKPCSGFFSSTMSLSAKESSACYFRPKIFVLSIHRTCNHLEYCRTGSHLSIQVKTAKARQLALLLAKYHHQKRYSSQEIQKSERCLEERKWLRPAVSAVLQEGGSGSLAVWECCAWTASAARWLLTMRRHNVLSARNMIPTIGTYVTLNQPGPWGGRRSPLTASHPINIWSARSDLHLRQHLVLNLFLKIKGMKWGQFLQLTGFQLH